MELETWAIESYREAKAVLDNMKSSAWSYFKFLSVCGVIGEYSAAACTRSAAFLEQVITTSVHAADEVESLHTKNDWRSKSAVVMHTKDTCKRSFENQSSHITTCNSHKQTDATIVLIFWVTLQNHKLCRKRTHSCSQSLRHWGISKLEGASWSHKETLKRGYEASKKISSKWKFLLEIWT